MRAYSRVELINYDPNCDLTAKSSHVGHHIIVDSNAKKLPNIMDHKSPLQAHHIIVDSNAKKLPSIIDHKSSLQAHHIIVDSNAKELLNIIDHKSPLQTPRNSVINNVVDTYPIIDRHDFSPKSVGPSTVKFLKTLNFLGKPPPLVVRSHLRTPEWLNHLTLVRQLTKT